MKKIVLPPLGEGIEKATVSYWYKQEGDIVKEGEDIVELSTDKATFNLPAPSGGTLVAILIKEGDPAAIGDVLGELNDIA